MKETLVTVGKYPPKLCNPDCVCYEVRLEESDRCEHFDGDISDIPWEIRIDCPEFKHRSGARFWEEGK